MIRPIVPADNAALVALSASSGLFRLDEHEAIQGALEEYHTSGASHGHQILLYEDRDVPVGMAWYAPRAFTDRVWELLMIAVDEPRQRQGIGSQLLLAVEVAVRRQHGRLMLIETSDKASFGRTRQFYSRHGYSEVARIPDYFADGDGKASFIKRI
jgi:GNAT superfamily N-acetyltransferase